MTERRERNAARRWSNRRITGDPNTPPPQAPEPIYESAATQLLSDYEDAVFASARHQLSWPGETGHADESRHLIEARRLHAEVRRLRMEILDLIDEI